MKKILGFTPAVWVWAIYDLANTIFSALFVSMSFPVLIIAHSGGTEELVGYVASGASLAAIVVVPFFGAVSDQTGRRLPILFCMTVGCCLLTPVVGYLPLGFAAIAGGLAIFSYNSGLALYDAILPDIVDEKRHGRVSGLGVGVGYGGTILALVCAKPIVDKLGADSLEANQILGWMVGVLFFVFALPLFLVHREKGSGQGVQWGRAFADGFGRVYNGARLASKHLWTFIASSFFTENAVTAVIWFFVIFATKVLGIPMDRFMMIYAGLAVSALVSSIVIGHIVDRVGPRAVLFGSGFAWIAICLYMMAIKTELGFIFAGIAGGAALGAVWTAQRPMLVLLGREGRMGETFGFDAIAGRSSAAVGPLVFGVLANRYSYNAALSSLIVFFVIGIVLLFFVPAGGDPEGKAGESTSA